MQKKEGRKFVFETFIFFDLLLNCDIPKKEKNKQIYRTSESENAHNFMRRSSS